MKLTQQQLDDAYGLYINLMESGRDRKEIVRLLIEGTFDQLQAMPVLFRLEATPLPSVEECEQHHDKGNLICTEQCQLQVRRQLWGNKS